jgi:hypothetical protein
VVRAPAASSLAVREAPFYRALAQASVGRTANVVLACMHRIAGVGRIKQNSSAMTDEAAFFEADRQLHLEKR